MDVETLCRETALHLFGDLRSEAAIQAGIGQVRPTVEFVAARVRAEAKAELDRERKRLLELGNEHYLNWRAAERALARLHAEVGERDAAVRAEAVAEGDREALGRAVRAEWMAWAQEQPSPKPSWLVPWDELAEPDREVDRRIGERLYGLGRAEAVADERQRIAALLVGWDLRPIKIAVADPGAILPRIDGEPVPSWCARAVRQVLLDRLAAGSVPEATPEREAAGVREEVNLADQFMPPSARIGDQEARRLGLMVTRPVATPTEPRGVDAVAEARREGWMPFGTLVDVQLPAGRAVQFSDELDEAGLPLWERIRSAGAPLDAPRTFG